METERIVLLIVILLFLIGGAYLTIKVSLKEWKKRVYVYPKTEHLYMPLYRCRMKNPTSGEWFDAIIYKGVEDEKFYVRERKDFLDKFVKLKDWENGNNSRQGVSEAD